MWMSHLANFVSGPWDRACSALVELVHFLGLDVEAFTQRSKDNERFSRQPCAQFLIDVYQFELQIVLRESHYLILDFSTRFYIHLY